MGRTIVVAAFAALVTSAGIAASTQTPSGYPLTSVFFTTAAGNQPITFPSYVQTNAALGLAQIDVPSLGSATQPDSVFDLGYNCAVHTGGITKITAGLPRMCIAWESNYCPLGVCPGQQEWYVEYVNDVSSVVQRPFAYDYNLTTAFSDVQMSGNNVLIVSGDGLTNMSNWVDPVKSSSLYGYLYEHSPIRFLDNGQVDLLQQDSGGNYRDLLYLSGNVYHVGDAALSAGASFDYTGTTSFSGPVRIAPGTLASLGTCNAGLEGAMATQTNSTGACSAGASATSAGTTHCQVYCAGSAWKQTGL